MAPNQEAGAVTNLVNVLLSCSFVTQLCQSTGDELMMSNDFET